MKIFKRKSKIEWWYISFWYEKENGEKGLANKIYINIEHKPLTYEHIEDTIREIKAEDNLKVCVMLNFGRYENGV